RLHLCTLSLHDALPISIARARILSARGLDHMLERMRTLEHQMANGSEEDRAVAMDKYAKTEDRLIAAGGYGASAEAARIASNLGDRKSTRLNSSHDSIS